MKRLLSSAAFAACTALALAAPAQAFDLGKMTDADRSAFRDEIRAYLLDNPEVIMEAVAVLEQREARAEAQADSNMVTANAKAIFEDGYSWVGGNPEGDVTLVEFIDYRCGYCRKAAPEVESLIEADGNIRLIVKEFPILGKASVEASRFAIAVRHVAGPDSYKDVHDALIGLRGEITDVSLRRLAEGLGLDADAIMERMNDKEITAELAQNRALAEQLKISGTPTFILEDQVLRGYLPGSQMQMLVDQKRKVAN
jgi:protein-disulfide isomerase